MRSQNTILENNKVQSRRGSILGLEIAKKNSFETMRAARSLLFLPLFYIVEKYTSSKLRRFIFIEVR